MCLICWICTYRKRDISSVHVRVVTVRRFRIVAVARLHAQEHLAESLQVHPKRADEVEVSKSSHRGKPMVEARRRYKGQGGAGGGHKCTKAFEAWGGGEGCH